MNPQDEEMPLSPISGSEHWAPPSLGTSHKKDMTCRRDFLFSWEMLHFLIPGSVFPNAACASAQWAM